MSGQTMFSSCLIKMLHLHYSITLTSCLKDLLQTVTCSDIIYIQFICIFIYINWFCGIFLCWVSLFCISQWKCVTVQLLDSWFICNVRFAVKCAVPLTSFRLNCVMINSSRNKTKMAKCGCQIDVILLYFLMTPVQ